MGKEHHFKANIRWTGNTGHGTTDARAYERSHEISIENKALIKGSSDPAFRGDGSKHNPEDMLISALSSCHMLWYLHLCADAGVVVQEYTDRVEGKMTESPDGGGHFTEVTLNPTVIVEHPDMIEKANELHHLANAKCFIANSVNFPVRHNPQAISRH